MSQTLTGRTRVREHRRLFRPTLYVLQVEVETRGREYCVHDGSQGPLQRYTSWRDFTLEDLIIAPTIIPQVKHA